MITSSSSYYTVLSLLNYLYFQTEKVCKQIFGYASLPIWVDISEETWNVFHFQVGSIPKARNLNRVTKVTFTIYAFFGKIWAVLS